MDWHSVAAKWTWLMGSARETWGELTDDELAKTAGNREKLIGIVQERYGLSKDEAAGQVDSWMEETECL